MMKIVVAMDGTYPTWHFPENATTAEHRDKMVEVVGIMTRRMCRDKCNRGQVRLPKSFGCRRQKSKGHCQEHHFDA